MFGPFTTNVETLSRPSIKDNIKAKKPFFQNDMCIVYCFADYSIYCGFMAKSLISPVSLHSSTLELPTSVRRFLNNEQYSTKSWQKRDPLMILSVSSPLTSYKVLLQRIEVEKLTNLTEKYSVARFMQQHKGEYCSHSIYSIASSRWKRNSPSYFFSAKLQKTGENQLSWSTDHGWPCLIDWLMFLRSASKIRCGITMKHAIMSRFPNTTQKLAVKRLQIN